MANLILSSLVIVALGATLVALMVGLISLFKGGEFSRKYSNRAMRWRILLQALVLILFFLMLWVGNR